MAVEPLIRPEVLNLGAVGIVGSKNFHLLIIMHSRMFNCIFGLYSLETSDISSIWCDNHLSSPVPTG